MIETNHLARNIAIAAGAVMLIWLAFLLGPAYGNTIDVYIGLLMDISRRGAWLSLSFTKGGVIIALLFLAIYGFALTAYLSTQGHFRRGEEHGSAKWGSVRSFNRKFQDKKKDANKILTQNCAMALDDRYHRRNLNTLVIGGSGAGKTRFFVKPNIMQANSTFIVLDPAGECLDNDGRFLKENGYRVAVIDLVEPEKSDHYNPLAYVDSVKDVLDVCSILFKATTPQNANSGDPFWPIAAEMLLKVLTLIVWIDAPPDERNFESVIELFDMIKIEGEEEVGFNVLDGIIMDLQDRKGDTPAVKTAVKLYNKYRQGGAPTLRSINITLASHLEAFDSEDMLYLTKFDDIKLDTIADRKTALFLIVPDDGNTTYNFIVSMLYQQLFQRLNRIARKKPGGRLPIPVHFIMDEFANVPIPDGFTKLIATIRKRRVFVSIILQNMAQLKTMFKDDWETITGNCDSYLFLGGSEDSTVKNVSERLGKSTIDTDSRSKSGGRTGSSSMSYQRIGRELKTPDEVSMMDEDECILFMRGFRPIIDKKYDIMSHPNVKETGDVDETMIYEHKLLTNAALQLQFSKVEEIDENEIKIDLGKLDEITSQFEIFDEGGLKDFIYSNSVPQN